MADATRIFHLHMVVADIAPPIWREVEVHSHTTLTRLHDVIQALMGWHDAHLWAFHQGSLRFELADPEAAAGLKPAADPAQIELADLLPKKGGRLRYNYDFGDDWWLEIKIVAIADAEAGARYPRCVAGARAGPLEDCGGLPGFEELLAARKNPKSKHARELLAWAGAHWDPEHFDLALTNKTLAALPAPRRLH